MRRTSPAPSIRAPTSWSLPFTANGRRQYVTLGSAREGWTQAKAQDQLERELAAVRLGTWTPREPEPASVVERDPTFHEFASDWLEDHKGDWRDMPPRTTPGR